MQWMKDPYDKLQVLLHSKKWEVSACFRPKVQKYATFFL